MKKGKLILVILSITMGLPGFSQEDHIKGIPSTTLGEVLAYLSSETGITFSYSNDKLNLDRIVKVEEGSFSDILSIIFPSQEYLLDHKDRKVIVRRMDRQITISGHVRDATTGELLFGATIAARNYDMANARQVSGTSTNEYGYFSLTLPAHPHLIEVSYVGYTVDDIMISGSKDTTVNISLKINDQNLNMVEVSGERFRDSPESHVNSPDLGKVQMSIGEIQSLPAFLGEVDLVKSIQLIPGVKNLGEGSTNLYVRGGGADQNLLILDEAPVYNPSHLMGFFSVFNQDALHSVDFYKGNFPAKYGGRLSSVLDIRMREGNQRNWALSGGIGSTAARLTLEGPIVENKSSLIISARRTYADLLLRFSRDEYTRETSLFFYDINAKANLHINNKNRLYFSGYFGRDLNRIRSLQYAIDWGNTTGTFRWNHIFGEKVFSNLSLISSNYEYLIDLPHVDIPFEWTARIRDLTVKYDFTHYVAPQLELKYGIHSTLHHFRPGESNSRPEESISRSNALDHAAYMSSSQELNAWLHLEYGLRISLFQLLGPASVEVIDPETQMPGSKYFDKGKIFKTYAGLEPRISARALLSDHLSLKAGYTRNRQYLNLLSNLSLGFNVFDIWIPSSTSIKPQISDQVALGLFLDSKDQQMIYSIEGYYKKLQNQISFRDHSRLILNKDIENELLFGSGKSYGIEAMARKTQGNLKGWISYTYARSKLNTQGINGGHPYPSPQDQPHNFNFSASYRVGPRWSIAANFIYATGRPITLPIESFWYDDRIVNIYGSRNASRLPDYHRLDLSANLYRKKQDRKNESYWTFAIYNVYDRHNAATAFVSRELDDLGVVTNSNKSSYHKLYILGIIPSITYNFKF